jgi:hypothetical protein
MKRILTAAAFAAMAVASAFGNPALAQSSVLGAEDRAMCVFLELAHESSCAELEAVVSARGGPAGLLPGSFVDLTETTGSIARPRFSSDPENFEPRTVPVPR